MGAGRDASWTVVGFRPPCFRAFLDRSLLELFVSDLACITQRLYPTQEDSLGLTFKVTKGSAMVHRLSVWKLAAIWPNIVPRDSVAE
jgi:beta-fructofuranosidase